MDLRNGRGEHGERRLVDVVDEFLQAVDELGPELGRPESDPRLEAARRALVRRWAALATVEGRELPWVLARLLRIVDRLDATDRGEAAMEEMSTGDWREVPIPTLRSWYADRAERSSLRAVGEECGVVHSTLHKFLSGGSTPHPRTRALLAEHYLRAQGVDDRGPTALRTLAGYFDPEQREDVLRRLLDVMESECARCGRAAPEWVSTMRR